MDTIQWGHRPFGTFSVKETYDILSASPDIYASPVWNHIWKPLQWTKIYHFSSFSCISGYSPGRICPTKDFMVPPDVVSVMNIRKPLSTYWTHAPLPSPFGTKLLRCFIALIESKVMQMNPLFIGWIMLLKATSSIYFGCSL